jgi:hypothetical protein
MPDNPSTNPLADRATAYIVKMQEAEQEISKILERFPAHIGALIIMMIARCIGDPENPMTRALKYEALIMPDETFYNVIAITVNKHVAKEN